MTYDEQRETSDGKNRKKILVVDDHPIVREGLTYLIEEEDDLVVCGSAENIPQAIRAIESLKPDVVTVDISLQDSSGLDLVKDIKVRWPDLPVLVLSVHPESSYAERAIRAGAKGYVTKQEATKKVITAIRKVLNGGMYLSRETSDRFLRSFIGDSKSDAAISPIDRLSDRELEVFSLLGQGKGTRQIAEQFCVSVKTVETYRLRIKEKLNIDSNSELLQRAFQWVSRQEMTTEKS